MPCGNSRYVNIGQTEGWVPKRTPSRERNAAKCVAATETQMGETVEYRGPEDIQYVFELLTALLTAGEIEDVCASLPDAIHAYWPAP